MTVALLAFLMDGIIGDPRSRYHPVAVMGSMIGLLDGLFYRQKDTEGKNFFFGCVLVLIVLIISYTAASSVLYATYCLRDLTGLWWLSHALEALCLSFMIAPKGLAAAGREIYELLAKEDLEEARRKVGFIVGRDTENLSPQEITRATVETVAENTVDGVVSPLFFYAVGGLPLAVLYRAANTMDSMIGYKNEKYLFFGRAAARLDDVLNYIPARLTALLFVAAAWLLKMDHRHALAMVKRDAKLHPSPNGGYAEAAVAGALHIRLGGENRYFGKKTFRAYMGDPIEALAPKHILAAVSLMYTVGVLFLIIAYIVFQTMGY